MYMWPSKFVGLTDWTTTHDIQPMNSGFGFGLKMINKCVYIYIHVSMNIQPTLTNNNHGNISQNTIGYLLDTCWTMWYLRDCLKNEILGKWS